MKKEKYIKWYNLAREVVQNDELIPNREPFVSSEDWLMFAPIWIESMKDAKKAPIPNVFFDLNSKGLKEGYGRLGLTFNNIKAVEKLRNILSNCCMKERDELTTALLSLENLWQIEVKRKIKYKDYRESPTYINEFNQPTNQIDENIIKKIFDVSDRIREEGKQNLEKEKLKLGKLRVVYREVPSINLMECIFELTEDNFKSRIREIFPVLAICLKVKCNREIKIITGEKKELLENLMEERQRITIQLKNIDFFVKLEKINDNEIAELKRKLKEIDKKIGELQLEYEIK